MTPDLVDGRVRMQGPRSPSPSLISGGASPHFQHTFERLDRLVDHVGSMNHTILDMRADFLAQCAELAAAQEESARRHALLADRVTELENRPLTTMMPPPSPAAAPSGPPTDVLSEMAHIFYGTSRDILAESTSLASCQAFSAQTASIRFDKNHLSS